MAIDSSKKPGPVEVEGQLQHTNAPATPRYRRSFGRRLRFFLYGMSKVLEIWPPPRRRDSDLPENEEAAETVVTRDAWKIVARNLWTAILEQKDLPMAIRKKYPLSDSLPPPEMLAEFEKVIPGSANRVFSDYEAISEHSRELDLQEMEIKRQKMHQELEMRRQELIGDIDDTRRGQWFGLIAGLTGIISGSLTAIFGAPTAGGFIGGGGIIGLVSVFVLGRYVKPARKS